MSQFLVAGNWKMNGDLSANLLLLQQLMAGLSGHAEVDVLVCPPAAYLASVGGFIKDTAIALGGQTMSEHLAGAYTGEISGEMLVDLGCEYVIVGHSERRALFVESNEVVAAKCRRAIECGLTAIFCVGETLAQREAGVAEQVIAEQLAPLLATGSLDPRVVIAYEPIWAIGTGKTASPEQAQAVHAFIRQAIGEADVKILYGGSVKAANAAELFAMTDINGALVGGAALNAEEFGQIILRASESC